MEKEKKNRNDKEEEITSLTDNKEGLKKKKFRKIALQKINLGTKPIIISFPKYEFLDYTSLSESKKKKNKNIFNYCSNYNYYNCIINFIGEISSSK